MVVRTLADLTLAPDDAPVTIDLAAALTDPDGDDLRYMAVASDSFRVAASAAGSRLTVTPLVPGRSTVRVVATDPAGLSLTIRFGVAISVGNRDYDLDDDGLIEVGNLAQLDAIRYDLTGDGAVDGAVWRPYYAAFPAGALGMGCPSRRGCDGYELTADVDFDTDGSGGPSRGDRYWNGGAGWEPLGVVNAFGGGFPVGRPFTGSFLGNGRTISNLFVDRPTQIGVGLFGYIWFGTIQSVGLENANVTGRDHVGALGGSLWLVEVDDSYATGRVSGVLFVGGLLGKGNHSVLTAGYATGRVAGQIGGQTGPLAGDAFGARIVASYWDTHTSGSSSGTAGEGQTTRALQAPRGYGGIYKAWNVDLDDDGKPDDPWGFGTSAQYPVLRVDMNGDGQATWQEFGYQVRDGPTLKTTVTNHGDVELAWTAVDVSHWKPAPELISATRSA